MTYDCIFLLIRQKNCLPLHPLIKKGTKTAQAAVNNNPPEKPKTGTTVKQNKVCSRLTNKMAKQEESVVVPAEQPQEINWETLGKKQESYSDAERSKLAGA